MRESLRPHWYRVIWELGRLRAYYCRATARCEKVIIAWTALGDVLRLRIDDEKAAFEYEREKAMLMCAWDECMYHTQQPLVTTRACKGCGEVVSTAHSLSYRGVLTSCRSDTARANVRSGKSSNRCLTSSC